MARMRATMTAVLISMASLTALVQEAVRFEVASVKPNATDMSIASGGRGGGSIGRQGQRFVAVNSPLRDIIRYAYDLKPFESIDGGPQWLNDRFDISAVIPQSVEGIEAPRAMLRTLLAERFGLGVRWSTREQPVYALVFARPDGRLGPRIKPSNADCSGDGAPRRPERPPRTEPLSAQEFAKLTQPVCDMLYQPFRARIIAGARTIDDLAEVLSRLPVLKSPVVNRTSLAARFDFELVYAPDRANPGNPSVESPPSVFVALEEQLGLRLESSRGPVRTLHIERIERPTPD